MTVERRPECGPRSAEPIAGRRLRATHQPGVADANSAVMPPLADG